MFLPTANRRLFLRSSALGLGSLAISQLLQAQTHHAAKAKRIIYLFMAGGPSQLDSFDFKPKLNELNGQNLPESVRKGQRLTGMSANQATLPLAGSVFKFAKHSGLHISELLPNTVKMIDDLCIVRSMTTEAINHDPAITFFQTGHQLPGRPSFGAWLSYGLGSANENLPAFVVLVSKDKTEQGLYARLWGSGFLESRHQGVQFRSGKEPVLYLKNPEGISDENRRKMLDRLNDLHKISEAAEGDPEISQRVSQYEMAYRMQMSVPEVMDLSKETAATFELYGPDAKTPGTFAANCLLARRLAERNVRFIQLYHPGWDHHDNCPAGMRKQTTETDRACYGLVTDLKNKGLLKDTLVVWGGEFGRTAYSQGKLTASNYGRDHHPRCFTIWMAGGGAKPGTVYGATDDFSYSVTENPVSVHDLQATLLHLLGIDHEKLTFKFQGRYYRLTDVHGTVVKDLVA